jgi:glutamate racemase
MRRNNLIKPSVFLGHLCLFLPMHASQPIGIFDSGYGGLTVMKEILGKLPQYDYVYLGDNARAPYGNRSFETVYRCTATPCNVWNGFLNKAARW